MVSFQKYAVELSYTRFILCMNFPHRMSHDRIEKRNHNNNKNRNKCHQSAGVGIVKSRRRAERLLSKVQYAIGRYDRVMLAAINNFQSPGGSESRTAVTRATLCYRILSYDDHKVAATLLF